MLNLKFLVLVGMSIPLLSACNIENTYLVDDNNYVPVEYRAQVVTVSGPYDEDRRYYHRYHRHHHHREYGRRFYPDPVPLPARPMPRTLPLPPIPTSPPVPMMPNFPPMPGINDVPNVHQHSSQLVPGFDQGSNVHGHSSQGVPGSGHESNVHEHSHQDRGPAYIPEPAASNQHGHS